QPAGENLTWNNPWAPPPPVAEGERGYDMPLYYDAPTPYDPPVNHLPGSNSGYSSNEPIMWTNPNEPPPPTADGEPSYYTEPPVRSGGSQYIPQPGIDYPPSPSE